MRLLQKDDSAEIRQSANLLLLACGQGELNEAEANNTEANQLLNLVAALAKSRRTDEAALMVYQRAAASIDYWAIQTFEELTKELTGPEIKKIDRRASPNGHRSRARAHDHQSQGMRCQS